MWYVHALHRAAQSYEQTLPANEQISLEQFDLLKKQFLVTEPDLRIGYFYLEKRPTGRLFNAGERLPLNFIYSWIDIFTYLANPKYLHNPSKTPFTPSSRLRALARAYTISFSLCLEYNLGINPNESWKYIIDPSDIKLIALLNHSANFYDTRFSFSELTPRAIQKIQKSLTDAEQNEAKAGEEKKSFTKSEYWYINAAIAKVQETYSLTNDQLNELNCLFLEVRRIFVSGASILYHQDNKKNTKMENALLLFSQHHSLDESQTAALQSSFNRICEINEDDNDSDLTYPPIPIVAVYHAIYQFFGRIRLLQQQKEKYNAENIALIFFLSFFAAMQIYDEYELFDFVLEAREPFLFERVKETQFTHCQLLNFKFEINCNGNNDIKDIYLALSEEDKKLFMEELTTLPSKEYTFKDDLLSSLKDDVEKTDELDESGFPKSVLPFFYRRTYKPLEEYIFTPENNGVKQ